MNSLEHCGWEIGFPYLCDLRESLCCEHPTRNWVFGQTRAQMLTLNFVTLDKFFNLSAFLSALKETMPVPSPPQEL